MLMSTRQVELPDYAATLPPLENLVGAGTLDWAAGRRFLELAHVTDDLERVRPGLPRRHDRAAAAGHAARAVLDDAKQDAAETIERARTEATTLLDQARAEAKAHLEQAQAEAQELGQSERPKPAPTFPQLPKTTPKDTWALPFDPPPLTPEDIAASRPLPRFFSRGTRPLQLHASAA
jgi:hypothetical protein